MYKAEEKNRIVKMILSKKKTVQEIAKASKDGPAESTIRKWIKEYKSKGPFVDDNRNDAIASWSGYSYQGKMSILCTIEKLNLIYGKSGWENWKLQLEKRQDFVLMNDMTIDSLWQVKALSVSRYQDYKDAMDKLLQDRNNSGFLFAECCLVTANEIDNWNEKGNVYQNDIFLYKYHGSAVEVTSVAKAIQEQLKILIGKMGIEVDEEAAYLLLCNLIDDKVAEFHKAGKKDQYIITFRDIVQQIEQTDRFEERISTLKQKEKIYKNLYKKIMQGSQNYCDEECRKKTSGVCEGKYCAVNRNKELVDGTDLELYMRSIRPEIEEDLDFIFSDPDDYADTICHSVHTSPADALEVQNNIVSIACYEGKLQVIPTMLDMSTNKEERLSRKLESIEKNQWLKENMGRKILLGKTGNHVYGTKLSKFTDIKLHDLLQNIAVLNNKEDNIEKIILNNYEREKATEISNSVIVADRECIVEYFEEDREDE